MKNKLTITIGILIVALFSFVALKTSTPAIASVSQGSEYNATTTQGMNGNVLLATGFGTFGSVVITGANTGSFSVYDSASTTINSASSTLLAQIPGSLAAGTYTFDARYVKGLVIVPVGTQATSTITYR